MKQRLGPTEIFFPVPAALITCGSRVIEINEERSFILGQILETHVDADKIIDAKKFKLDISKIDPLVYCARAREYWSVGKKLGDGFNAGKALIKKVEVER